MSEWFFDNNANYPISREVIEYYDKSCTIGNISCKTKVAEKGRQLIEGFIDFLENEASSASHRYKAIITSGGSESNSTVIQSHVYNSVFLNKIRPHFVTSTVEHPSITEYLIRLERDDVADITWIKPASNGEVPIDQMVNAIRPATVCVFLQSVNSETGCEQNIVGLWKQIQQLQRRPSIHVDHVQGYRKIDLPPVADTIAISLHKIGAPLGIGTLLYRDSMRLTPLIAGKQNDGMRGGTYNIGAITAASRVLQTFKMKDMSHYKKYFLQQLGQTYNVVQFGNGHNFSSGNSGYPSNPTLVLFSDMKCLPHTLFMTFIINGAPVCGQVIKEILFRKGYTVGTGTACSNESKDKEVRGSMASSDINEQLKMGFVRISFNNTINEKILKRFASAIRSIPDLLRPQ